MLTSKLSQEVSNSPLISRQRESAGIDDVGATIRPGRRLGAWFGLGVFCLSGGYPFLSPRFGREAGY
jgi:hypothetical protein